MKTVSSIHGHLAANKVPFRPLAQHAHQPIAAPQADTRVRPQRKTDCACGGGCPRCNAAQALPVSQPGDALEQAADVKAEQVLRKVDSQALANTASQTPDKVTQLFGSYFNTDFSGVRLH